MKHPEKRKLGAEIFKKYAYVRMEDTYETDLLKLERTPAHLLLTFRGGIRAFVQGSIDTYHCEVERDGAKTSVQFKVQSLMGIQLISA